MRSRPVDHPDFLEYQATILLCIAAAGLSILRFQGRDLDFLIMDAAAWPQEPWRLLTSCLLHGGWLHLAFNLYWILRFGYVLEPIFGSLPMVGIFVFLGAGSSAADWAVSGPAIGLSGIGYGLFGLTWALDRYTANYRGILDQQTTALFVAWFFFCIVASIGGFMPVANVAHGAGAVLGGLLGLSLSPYAKRRRPARLGLALLVPLIAVASTVGRPYVNFSRSYSWELFDQATAAYQRGDLETALDHLQAAARRDPDEPAIWNNLGVVYGELGREEEAREAFRRKAEARSELQEESDRPRTPMDLLDGRGE
jgi:membrane associated rhomboid family serine protease